MQNITLQMLRYREAARHLWNAFLKGEGEFGRGEFPDHDTQYDWEALKDTLFVALVLRHAGAPGHIPTSIPTRLSAELPIPFLRVVPTSPEVPAMISRTKPAQTYWDNPVQRLGPDDDLRFISFFDWDQSGFLDFTYYRVAIRSCARAPELAGHEALIEVQYAHVFVDAG